MEELIANFFKMLFEATPLAIVALLFGWIGAGMRSYFSEKGKNVATKEDIDEIQDKIESIKYQYERSLRISNTLLSRKILASDKIIEQLTELQLYCLRQAQRHNEHAVPYGDLPRKSSFQRAVHIYEVAYTQRVFISRSTFEKINNLAQDIFMLGSAEMHVNEVGDVKSDHYDRIRLAADTIIIEMHNEMFPDERAS